MYTKHQNLLANHVILMGHYQQHGLNPNQHNNPEKQKQKSEQSIV